MKRYNSKLDEKNLMQESAKMMQTLP